jgi:hypothetical protein
MRKSPVNWKKRVWRQIGNQTMFAALRISIVPVWASPVEGLLCFGAFAGKWLLTLWREPAMKLWAYTLREYDEKVIRPVLRPIRL